MKHHHKKNSDSQISPLLNQKRTFQIQKNKKISFKCQFSNCSRKFREKGNLKTHIRTHTGEKPYKCPRPNCEKTFMTLGNLKSHQLNHSDGENIVCDIENCGKIFNSREKFKIHEKTHVGKVYFKCPVSSCGKQFNEKGNLKTHYRIHTGEKPYPCSFPGCLQAFKALGHLKDHLKIHYNIKPYECKLCGLRFARSSTLKIHNRTHTGEKPHSCYFPGCSKKFSEKGNMKTHYKTHLTKNKIQCDFVKVFVKEENTEQNENEEERKKIAMQCLLQENRNDGIESTAVRTPIEQVQDIFLNFQSNLLSEIVNLVKTKNVLRNLIENNNVFIQKLLEFNHHMDNAFDKDTKRFVFSDTNFDFLQSYCGDYIDHFNLNDIMITCMRLINDNLIRQNQNDSNFQCLIESLLENDLKKNQN